MRCVLGGHKAAHWVPRMATRSWAELTQLLSAWERGDGEAFAQLVETVYETLHQIAARELRREPAQSLQATALVNEAYLKLAGQRRAHWHNRRQFFAVATRIMQRVLIDHARERHSQKRGGRLATVSLSSTVEAATDPRSGLQELKRALARLGQVDPRLTEVVELHAFAGCTNAEIADLLRVSVPTVVRWRRRALAWLAGQLSSG